MFFISYHFGERSHNVQAPLSKWPRARKRIENSSKLVNIWHEPLTLITFLNVFLRLLLHTWSLISLGNSPMRQGSSSGVTPTNPFHVASLRVILMPRDIYKANKGQRKNACITFYPRTAKTEELFFVLFQLRNSLQAVYLFPGMVIWNPSSLDLTWSGGSEAYLSVTK